MEKADPASLSSVYNTIKFIEDHYSEPITAKDLENISHYSYRNIQRIFKYTCGITIGAYQTKLKVENAYKLILYSKESLTSIAYEVGFADLAAFSKAFKQHFGLSPGKARSNRELLLTEGTIIPVESEMLPDPSIIFLPSVTVYYESAFFPYSNELIDQLWGRFLQNGFPATGTEYYGLIVDDPLITEEINCRYDACSSRPALHKTLTSKTVLGGRYVEFLHYGGYATIEETYSKIYSRWMLESTLEFAHTPVVERYSRNAANTASERDYLTSILLPLK